jgi:hypothetical protein
MSSGINTTFGDWTLNPCYKIQTVVGGLDYPLA